MRTDRMGFNSPLLSNIMGYRSGLRYASVPETHIHIPPRVLYGWERIGGTSHSYSIRPKVLSAAGPVMDGKVRITAGDKADTPIAHGRV